MAGEKAKKIWGKEVRIAWAVLAAAILISIPVGFTGTMNRMYDKVAAEFEAGAEQDGLSIQADLEARIGAACNLATVAKRYIDADSKTIQEVTTAAASLVNMDSPAEKYAANEVLDVAFYQLYEALGELGLSEKDEQYRQALLAEMKSRSITIKNDPYNQLAQEYNQKLERFPANLLSKLFQVKKAELFG